MFRCCVLVAVILMTLSSFTQALIVPQELPSILSLVYSNIPPIRKGTDSRLGFGFRLGEHADFQVVVELGPQKDTRPISSAKNDEDSSNSKRQVNPDDYKKPRRTITTTTTTRPVRTTESSNDYSWLRDWFGEWTGTRKRDNNNSRNSSKIQNKNSINEVNKKGYVKTVPMISESALKQLQQLYKMATMNPIVVEDETTPTPSSSEENKNIVSRLHILSTRRVIPARKTKGEITEELMDVNLE